MKLLVLRFRRRADPPPSNNMRRHTDVREYRLPIPLIGITLEDMYQTCPQCDHRRRPTDEGSADICPRCGLVFSKWMRNRFRVDTPAPAEAESEGSLLQRFKSTILYVPSPIDPVVFYGRALLYIVEFRAIALPKSSLFSIISTQKD